MNIQIFRLGNMRITAIDMEKVKAIYEAEAKTIQQPDESFTYEVHAMLDLGGAMPENDYHVSLSMTLDELKEQMAFQKAPIDDNGHSFFVFNNEQALQLMCRYWRDIQDTPLTKKFGIRKIGRIEK